MLPKADIANMVPLNVEGQGFATYSPNYVAQSCKLPNPHIYFTEKGLKRLDLDIVDNVWMLSTQMALLHPSVGISYVGTQKDIYELKVA